RPRVDLFDDNRAIKARARSAVGQGLPGQRTRDHDRIGGHSADMDLAGVAVDDLGGGADKGPHRQYRAGLDDNPLDDFAARPDKAIVLDDDRLRLQRLEHTADPDP